FCTSTGPLATSFMSRSQASWNEAHQRADFPSGIGESRAGTTMVCRSEVDGPSNDLGPEGGGSGSTPRLRKTRTTPTTAAHTRPAATRNHLFLPPPNLNMALAPGGEESATLKRRAGLLGCAPTARLGRRPASAARAHFLARFQTNAMSSD